MKKVMLVSLILLPLIILIILSASTAIVSATNYVYVESVEIVGEEETLVLYKTFDEPVPSAKLQVNVFPLMASNKELTFRSDDESVAEVSGDGTVYGVGFGETYVYAVSKENPIMYAIKKVIVTDSRVHSLTVENPVNLLYVNDEYALEWTINPDGAENKAVTFESSDTTVATVSFDGVITALRKGFTQITVTSVDNPEAKQSFELQVKTALSDAAVDGDLSTVVTASLEARFPDILVYPADADYEIGYSSSDNDTAFVDDKGNIFFKKAGEVKITAWIVGTSYSFVKTYISTAGYLYDINLPDEINIDYEEYFGIKPLNIEIVKKPSDAPEGLLSYEVSSGSAVRISDDGLLEVTGGGSAVITVFYATSKDGVLSKSVTVNVARKVQALEFGDSRGLTGKYLFAFDEVFSPKISVSPKDATYGVKLSTDSEGVVTEGDNVIFSENDYYRTAEIVCTTNDGEFSETFTVVYLNPKKVTALEVTEGACEITLDMPKAVNQQILRYAFYASVDGADEITVSRNGKETGLVETTQTGAEVYTVQINGEYYSTVTVNTVRRVEAIEGVALYNTVEGIEYEVGKKGEVYYTAARNLELRYSLYPSDTTLESAQISVEGCASYVDGQLVFSEAGEATVTLTADSVTRILKVYSTFGRPDEDTVTVQSLVADKGDVITLSDVVRKILPLGADGAYISFAVTDGALEITDGGIKALYGAKTTLVVNIDTADGQIRREIEISILEEPEEIRLKDNRIVLTENRYTVGEKDFSILPATSNVNLDYTVTVEYGKADVIDGRTVVFDTEGEVGIAITLGNGIKKIFTLIYAGDLPVLNGDGGIAEVEAGQRFVFDLPAGSRLNYDGISALKGMICEDGIMTVTDAVANENEEFSASFNAAGTTYRLKGIHMPVSVSAQLVDSSAADTEDGGYVTSLKEAEFSAVTDENSTYKATGAVCLDKEVADVVESDGIYTVVFKQAGSATIRFYSEKNPNVYEEVRIRSTFGYAERAEFSLAELELDYDSLTANSADLSEYVSVFPSQSPKTSDTLSLVSSAEGKVAINGLSVIAAGGGSAVVGMRIKTADGEVYADYIRVSVKRSADSISVNGEVLNGATGIVELANGIVNLDVKAMPADATYNNDVSVEIVAGGENAELTGAVLWIKKAGATATVRYTLTGTDVVYEVTYKALTVVYNADATGDTVVVPYEMPFVLRGNAGETYIFPEEITSTSDGNEIIYNALSAGIFVLRISDGSSEREARLIVTRRATEIGEIFVTDFVNAQGMEDTFALGNGAYVTASKSVTASFEESAAVNADGGKPEASLDWVIYGSATISGNTVVFGASGEAKIRITLYGKDCFGEYSLTADVDIKSTYGTATEFSVENPVPDGIVMDETSQFVLPKPVITAPAYGGDEIIFSYSGDGNVLTASDNGEVKAIASGDGYVEILSCDTSTNDVTVRRIDVRVDKYVDEIVFADGVHEGYVLSDYTNGDYAINSVLLADAAKPTLTRLLYRIVSESRENAASVSEDGVVTFDGDYAVVNVEVCAEAGGASAVITLVKVAEDVTVIELDGTRQTVAEKGIKYAVDIVGMPYFEAVVPQDLITENQECGVFLADTGKIADVAYGGESVRIIFTEAVESVTVQAEEKNVTAQSSINLDEYLRPSFYPATAHDENGAVQIRYVAVCDESVAEITDGILTFRAPATVSVYVWAGDKSTRADITSTCGYVSAAEWTKDEYEFYLSDGGFTLEGEYKVEPSDVSADKYFVTSTNESVATVQDGEVTFVRGGKTTLRLCYYTANGVLLGKEISLVVHNPVETLDIMYGDYVTDVIYTDLQQYALETRFDKSADSLSDYTLNYLSSDAGIATVDGGGRVMFKAKDVPVTVTVTVINSDGSEVKAAVSMTYTSGRIILVDKNTANGAESVLEYGEKGVFFVLPDATGIQTEVAISQGSSVVLEGAAFTAVSGGTSAVEITSADGTLAKTLNVYVYRKTTSVGVSDKLSGGTLYTAATSVALGVSLYPADSAERKTVRYTLGDSETASVADGVLAFNKAGTVKVRIDVLYDGVTEISRTLEIRSSFGKIESFGLSEDGVTELNSFVFEDSGISRLFRIIDVAPSDYVLGDYEIYTDNSDAFAISKSGGGVSVTSVDRGTGEVRVTVDGVTRIVGLTANLKVKSVVLSYGATVLQDVVSTMCETLALGVAVSPLNANDTSLVWSVSGGGSMDEETNTLYLPAAGKYTVKVSSADGGFSRTYTFDRVDTLDNFSLIYAGKEYVSSSVEGFTVEMDYNVTDVVLEIGNLPEGFIGVIDFGVMNIQADDGIAVSKNASQISLSIPAYSESSPVFRGNVLFSAGTSLNVILNRDGIKSIEFTDHDNVNDASYGLQQIRVFGKKSYYDGAVRDYYKMPISVKPAGAAKNLVWSTDNPNVKVEYKQAEDTVYIYFNNVTGNSETDVRNDVFDKTVTVTATNATGTIKDSYTFHIVNNGVNVFDQAGFLANGEVVLHVNLGDTEEENLSKFARYTYAANPSRSLIYGNGFIVNFNSWNNQYTSSMGNNLDTSVGRVYNTNLKGANYDATKGNYHNNFSGSYFFYTKIQQTYKGIWATEGTQIRNCYFRYIVDMSVQISGGDKKAYVENIISIDGGNAALECQNESFYLKGFIDVYNFKSKNDLKDLAGTSTIADWLLDDLKDKGDFVRDVNGEAYFNVVLYSGKTGGKDRPLYLWSGTEYVEFSQGSDCTAVGLKKLSSSMLLLGTVAVYSYELSVIDYYDQYNADGTENNANLSLQEQKLLRQNRK